MSVTVPGSAVRRPARRGQMGFTLIELIVAMALLTIITGAMAGAFDIGSKVLGTGGAGDRLAAAQSGMVIEQVLSRDVSRAACIRVGAGTATGSCAGQFANASISGACTASTTVLCVAWPWVSDPGGASCLVAVYGKTTSANPAVVSRTEWRVASGSASIAQAVQQTTNPVTFTVNALPAGGWATALVTATVAGNLTANDPTEHLSLRPLVADPNGPATAAFIPQGGQC